MNVMMKSKPFTLAALPYGEGALEPMISGRTMSFHYGKHHKAYVDKLNELVTGTKYADVKLEDIVKSTFGHAAGVQCRRRGEDNEQSDEVGDSHSDDRVGANA
jgi:superoxide dismutase